MRRSSNVLVSLAIGAMLLPLTGCGSDGPQAMTLTVFAAASLTGTFTELGRRFEADHPGVKVTFNFGGSSDLVTQIQGGAPADVFASADTKNLEKLIDDGLAGQDPEHFASNTLEIVTPPDNPEKIAALVDLTKPEVDLVICAPEVPCGSAAAKVAEAAGLTLKPVSEEQSVKDVLAKVTVGEAEAGLVYVTDVKAAGDDVLGIVFPESSAAVNTYPITTVEDSDHGDLAAEFVALVLSTVGQDVLAAAGFAPAP